MSIMKAWKVKAMQAYIFAVCWNAARPRREVNGLHDFCV